MKTPMKKIITILPFVVSALTGMAQEESIPASNPFSKESSLPYSTEPFDKIKDADYKPAFEAGMRDHLKEIESIANNTAPAAIAYAGEQYVCFSNQCQYE